MTDRTDQDLVEAIDEAFQLAPKRRSDKPSLADQIREDDDDRKGWAQ